MQSHILLPGQIPTSHHRLNRIQVVPFSYHTLKYKTRQITQSIPIQKTFIQFKPKITKKKIPVQKKVVQYIPVLKKKEIVYQPRLKHVKSWDCLEVEKKEIWKGEGEEQRWREKEKEMKGKDKFRGNKYCRLGKVFIDKYFNDEPAYEMNALSTHHCLNGDSLINGYTTNEKSRISQLTHASPNLRNQMLSQKSAIITRDQLAKSSFFSEYQKTRVTAWEDHNETLQDD